MKSILNNLLALIVGLLGCAIYLIFAVIGSIVTLVVIGTIINLIF